MTSELRVFLLMGQSNMAGRGRLDDVPPLAAPGIFMFRDGSWLPAEEPLHTDKPKIAGVGLGMSVAVELTTAMDGAPIGLVPVAVGGTPLGRWMPQGDLYENAVSIAKNALVGNTLAGVLWHQGEHDSCREDETATYIDRFRTMVDALREELSAADAPVVAGELGHFLKMRDGCKHFEAVNRQLRDLEGVLSKYACARADGLTCNGDNLHFNAESLREFGRRYAQRYVALKTVG